MLGSTLCRSLIEERTAHRTVQRRAAVRSAEHAAFSAASPTVQNALVGNLRLAVTQAAAIARQLGYTCAPAPNSYPRSVNLYAHSFVHHLGSLNSYPYSLNPYPYSLNPYPYSASNRNFPKFPAVIPAAAIARQLRPTCARCDATLPCVPNLRPVQSVGAKHDAGGRGGGSRQGVRARARVRGVCAVDVQLLCLRFPYRTGVL